MPLRIPLRNAIRPPGFELPPSEMNDTNELWPAQPPAPTGAEPRRRKRVCGVDEAGRGPLAGPVVAAAVVLHARRPIDGVRDSKLLTPLARERLAAAIRGRAVAWAIGVSTVAEIERFNILQASLLAMRRALEALPSVPAMALVDGNQLPALPCPAQAVIGGDGRSLSIAAASIIAKVTRDRLMNTLAEQHPGYGWKTNVGYGTPEHLQALVRLGVTPYHRRSFRPVYELLPITP
jgi:ribonuclease HII